LYSLCEATSISPVWFENTPETMLRVTAARSPLKGATATRGVRDCASTTVGITHKAAQVSP
jgi:hypothetical protein